MFNLDFSRVILTHTHITVLSPPTHTPPPSRTHTTPITHTHTHTDAVTSEDVQRVGKRLMESSPAFAALGDLSQVPSRTELEEALFRNKGIFRSKRSLFSFGQT